MPEKHSQQKITFEVPNIAISSHGGELKSDGAELALENIKKSCQIFIKDELHAKLTSFFTPLVITVITLLLSAATLGCVAYVNHINEKINAIYATIYSEKEALATRLNVLQNENENLKRQITVLESELTTIKINKLVQEQIQNIIRVYVSEDDKEYFHRSVCGRFYGKQITGIPLWKAYQEGYAPCGQCKPSQINEQ